MKFNKSDMIEQLKLEIQMIEKGGYNPPVRHPREEARAFRDSVTCLNYGLKEKKEPCSNCFLSVFVPLEHLDKDEPCHHILLNDRGDTVASLRTDPYTLQTALLAWLKETVARLEFELSAERR